MSETRSRLLKGAAWIAFGSIIANSLGFISTIIMARLLMPEDFGLVAICVAFMMILTSIAEMPLSEALVQHDDPSEAHFDTVWSMSVLRSLILGGLIAALSYPVAMFYGDIRLQDILLVMAASVAFSGFINPKLAIFQRELVFHQAFLLKVGEKAAGFIVALVLAIVFRSYWALVFGAVVSDMARVVISFLLYPYRPRVTFSRCREILSFSIWITFGTWIQAINWRANPLVFGAVLPTGLLGQYSFGIRVTGVVIGQLAQPVQDTFFPAFSRFKNNKDQLRSAYIRAQGVACSWIFPFAFGLAVVAHDLVYLVLGAKWEAAIPVIQLQAISVAMQATAAIQPIAMATGNTKALFYRDIRAFVIRWPLMLAGIYLGSQSAYGMLIGGLIGNALATFANVVLNMSLVGKITDVGLKGHLSFVIRPLAGVVVMALMVFGLGLLVSVQPNWIAETARLVGLILLGALAYIATLWVIWRLRGRKEGAETEIVQLSQKLLAKRRKAAPPA
ncbi:hypothetical protein DL1_20140 [Thioclava dalianensis]|uniref:Polysaccharide biosynthesis protein C-terminal domain-containing protein n=1 Tax=Thioclava dalianensis TaxID=1185766 RepID=A0A074U655_9RHOB|nr:lipopolysaccharide biosynthesis protein [Thioclava dalianensis]KEP70132.1 hypothetical protein DL1_20140 [Thioclava dalianensis]SFN51457.1 Membrane protein involved in the export of O-antigen and teichoic acid [Thioclava dalianensis]